MAKRASAPAAPLVSAIIPARNAASHLSRAIESALAQTYVPLEVIVIDDGSENATHEKAVRYGARLRPM